MALYLLKFSACLLLFLAFYKLVLEKENMHVFKRFFLLGALILSVCIPLVTFTYYVEPTSTAINSFSQDLLVTNNALVTEPTNYLLNTVWAIYIIGVLLFGYKFIRNLYQLNNTIKFNPKRRNNKFTHVLLKDLIVPHTFFNYLFFNKSKFEAQEIPEEVFWHEQTHAVQKHSIDVLFIEALQVLFWFNPLIYIIKHTIKLNHEFLADRGVLQKGINTNTYQEIILAFSSNATQPQLANAINYSLIKKRFTVMKTQTTKQGIWLRSLILLPLLAIMLYSFSETNVVEKGIAEIDTSIQEFDNDEQATEVMMKEYNAFIEGFESTNMVVMGKYNRAVAIYDLMTIEQRESVKELPKIASINLSKIKAKQPTRDEFNSWKNKDKFAIWIDGKYVQNSELNNYSLEDISHYSGSFVYNNARTKKHPQEYQYHLYTKKGFEKTFQNSNINKYKSQAKKYTDALSTYLKTNSSDNSELQILKAQADKVYTSFSSEDIAKHNILKTPPLPSQNKTQEKATKAQVKEYNKLAKKYNDMPEDGMIIKKNDLERLKYLYSIMSSKQRKSAESFPYIPAPPAPRAGKPKLPPPPPPIPADASIKDKKKYQEAIQNYKRQAEKAAKANNELVKIREINNADRVKLRKVKEQYVVERAAMVEAKKLRVVELKENQVAQRVLQAKERKLILEKVKVTRMSEKEALSEERKIKLVKEKLQRIEEIEVVKDQRKMKLVKEKLQRLEEKEVAKDQQKREMAIAARLKKQEERVTVREIKAPKPPKSPIDHVIEMAKNNAVFYFEGKEISSDDAIKKLRNNKKINVRTIGRDSKRPKVHLSTKPMVVEIKEKN